MSAIRFFVLTPTYNRAQRVVRAIESVRRQTHPDWEMFVYDDGSSDDTPERLKRFSVDDRIHVWRDDENRGANVARNALLERILERNEPGYIAILDDDDFYLDDALERVAREIERSGQRWLIGRCRTAEGQSLTQLRRSGEIDYVRDHKFGNRLKGEVAHFFHTGLVGKTRFTTRYRNAEEWYFYYELARRAPMWVLDFDATVMEYLDDGLSRSQPNAQRKTDLYRLKLERLGPTGPARLRARLHAKLARQHFVAGEREKGRQELRRAFDAHALEPRIYPFFLRSLLPSGLGGF